MKIKILPLLFNKYILITEILSLQKRKLNIPFNESGERIISSGNDLNNQVAVINLAARGNNLSPRGNNLAARGNNLSPRGNKLTVRGIDLSVRGNDLSPTVINLPLRGNNLSAGGIDLSVRGKNLFDTGKYVSGSLINSISSFYGLTTSFKCKIQLSKL